MDRIVGGYIVYMTLCEVINTMDTKTQSRVKNATDYLFKENNNVDKKDIGSTLVTILPTLGIIDYPPLMILGASINQNLIETSPVYKICLKRVRQTLFQMVKGQKPTITTPLVVTRLNAFMDRFSRIVKLNIDVYSSQYNDILVKLV